MRRTTTLAVERLETKALLSGLSHSPAPGLAAPPVFPPVQITGNRTPPPGILSSLTTDKSVYQAGQPIRMTFTETDVARHPISIAVGPSIDGFVVIQNGKPVWVSNAGIQPLYVMVVTLQPGQSYQITSAWDGKPNMGIAGPTIDTGTFIVSNELDPQGAAASFQIVNSSPQPAPTPTPIPAPPQPPIATPTPAPTPTPTPAPIAIPSPVSITLTTDHAAYRRGHPVHLRLIITDVGDGAVRLAHDRVADALIISRGSIVVWHSKFGGRAFRDLVLQPGQSIALTIVWRGRPRHPRVAKLVPDMYTIQATVGGSSGSAMIRIV